MLGLRSRPKNQGSFRGEIHVNRDAFQANTEGGQVLEDHLCLLQSRDHGVAMVQFRIVASSYQNP